MSRRLASTNALRAAPIAALLLAGFAATLYFAVPTADLPRLAPGVWLAITVPVEPRPNPPPLANVDDRSQLHVVNTADGEDFELGELGVWVSLAWSPDGRYLYATQILDLGDDDAAGLTVKPTVFDVPRRRVAASAVWPWDDCLVGADRASWSPDGSRVALPGQSCAAVLEPDGSFHLLQLGPDSPASGGGGRVPAWAPDSSRYIYQAGIREAVIIDHAASTSLFISEASWPAAITGASAWQPDSFSWIEPSVLRMLFRTFPDPRSETDNAGEPMRFWSVDATYEHNRLLWGSPQEADPLTYFPVVPGEGLLREGHGRNDPEPYRLMLSDDLQFAAAVPSLRTAAPLEDPLFVTIIDGVRFAYPLGPNFLAATAFEYRGKWDMVRVE